ncbi:MAG: alpha/beta fold hydrolase [Gammaproteobacteria bacterium]
MTRHIIPTLVLLPGFDGSGRLFSPIHKELSDCVNTIVLSYPSDKVMTYSDLCHYLKDELPDSPYVLLGESFGGPLAMMLLKYADENLKGIILCASFVKNPQVLLTRLIRPFLKPKYLQKETPAWHIRTILVNGVSDTKLIRNIQAATAELSREVYFYRLREIADVDVTHIVGKCELPILYLRAKKDRLVYESSMKLIEKLGKNVTVEKFDAPHMLLQTQPKQTAQSIKRFLDSVIK